MQHDTLIAEIEGWLLDSALEGPDIHPLFESLCHRLHAAGLPLDRAALSWPTLHPLFQAEQLFWTRGETARLLQYPHSAERSEAYLASPFHHVLAHDLDRLRRRLEGPGALIDFPVLADLQAAGFTDYLMTATPLGIARVSRAMKDGRPGIIASWATRRPGGFSADDIVALSRIQKSFAVACHAAIQMRVMEALAAAYLGPTAGARVLSGNTRLGDGEMIRAVVWFSDLRGSTMLSGQLGPQTYLDFLRDYYDCTAGAVIAEGGEVLDFIGDGVLAIFPLRSEIGAPEAVRAATRAMETALARLDARRDGGAEPAMQFSISLALGEVMFGNIGVPARLAFSAIGAVVNTVTRIDRLTKELGRAVLVTGDIAAVEPARWTGLGTRMLEGSAEPVAVFARAAGTDRFDYTALQARLRAARAG